MKTVKTFFLNLFHYGKFWLLYPIVDLFLLIASFLVSLFIGAFFISFFAIFLLALSGIGVDYTYFLNNSNDNVYLCIFYVLIILVYCVICFEFFSRDHKDIVFFKTNSGMVIIPLYLIARVIYIYINHGEFNIFNAFEYLSPQLIWGLMFLLMPLLIVIDLIATFKKTNPKQVYDEENLPITERLDRVLSENQE